GSATSGAVDEAAAERYDATRNGRDESLRTWCTGRTVRANRGSVPGRALQRGLRWGNCYSTAEMNSCGALAIYSRRRSGFEGATKWVWGPAAHTEPKRAAVTGDLASTVYPTVSAGALQARSWLRVAAAHTPYAPGHGHTVPPHTRDLRCL